MKLLTMVKIAVPFALVAGIIVFASVYVAGHVPPAENQHKHDHDKRHVFDRDFEDYDLEGSASEVVNVKVAPPFEVDRRMGVVGPVSTHHPPRFHESESRNSKTVVTPLRSLSRVGEGHVREEGRLLPLSPHSPHNVFSVHEGIGVLADERQFFEDLNELRISSSWDLSLKLRALEKAQEDIGFPTQKVLVNGTVQCEAFITTEEFYIRSPNYPYNYPSNLTCDYNIYRRAGSCGVELTVLRFDLASPDPVTGYCRDNLRVMGRPFCGRRQRGETALLTFPGLLLPLSLETGPGHGASGVLLQGRQVTDCRETRQLGRPLQPTRQCVSSLQGEKFTLRSPGYPDSYPHNAECWYFVQRRSPGHCGVELKVKTFSVEAASCMFDYVEVGQERICGDKEDGTKYYFPFEGSKLSIRFRSDESITRPGFVMEAEQVKCDDMTSQEEEEYHDPKTLQDFISATAERINFVSSAATVTSTNAKPHHSFDGNQMSNDDDINYILSLVGKAPPPHGREEERPSRQHLGRDLNTEEGTETTVVPNEVQQELVTEEGSGGGEVTEAPEVGQTSDEPSPTGTITPDTTVAPEGDVTTIQGINGVPTPSLSILGSDESSVGPLGPCDEVFGDESFTLRSHKVTGILPKKLDCSYIIKRVSDDVCELRIVLMEVALAPRAATGQCEGEHLLIAGDTFCGGDNDRIVHLQQPGALVRINLHAEAAYESTGFTARVHQLRGSACHSSQPALPSAPNCDVILTEEVSTIFSPLYPNPYPENSNCLVTVRKTDPSVQSVTLFLEEFNIEESPDCRRHYFAVSSARLCGHRSGETINFRFPAHELLMEFRSDYVLQRRDTAPAAHGYRIHVRQNRFQPFIPAPFGSSGHSPAPFGSSGHSPAPFGSSGHSPAPFGSSGHSPAPFGSSGHSPAPFGSSGHSPVPFGSSGYTPVPFGSSGHSPAPFGSIGHSPVPFGSSGHSPAPFGSSGHSPVPFGSSGYGPPPSNTGSQYPSSTLRPPPPFGVQLPLAGHSGPPTTFTPSKVIVGGAGPTVTLRPPTVPEVATDVPTITHCGENIRQREVVIKSPGFPDSPPKNLHCTYKIEKISNDVCQLRIEIHEMKLGGQTDCGHSFLQVGAQQRLCKAQRGNDIRTYHFTEDVMEINFHTDSEELSGGFYISVQQTPCGHFEPIGTFSNLETNSGVQVVTGGPSISLITTQVTTVHPTKPIIQSNFGANIIDTSVHYNGHGYHSYPTFPPLKPTKAPVTTPPTTQYPEDYNLITPSPHPPHHEHNQHFVYYYLPGDQFKKPKKPRPQQQQRPQYKRPHKGQKGRPGNLRPQHKQPHRHQESTEGKGYGFMHNMKSKYEKMKKLFYKKGNNNNKGSVEVEAEVSYSRPRPRKPKVDAPLPRHPRRPTIPRQVQFTPGRPQRYQFVRNPYYRPREVEHKKPTPTVRFRYPQVHSPPNRPILTTSHAPGFRHQNPNTFILIPTGQAQLQSHQTVTGRPSLYTAAPRPVYVTTPRPVYLATRRPTLAYTQRPVIRVTNPQPIVAVTTPRPYITTTRIPPSSSTIYFPPTPTPAVVRYQNAPLVQGSGPVVGYKAFIVTGRPSWGHGRTAAGNRGKELEDSPEQDQLLSSESVVSSITSTDCGRVIREDEFYIRSPDLVSPDSIGKDEEYCTYTIAKSGSDRCSLVLEVEDFKQVGKCVEDNSLRCDPAAHMLTRFSPDGDLLLQFNRTVDAAAGGAVFTVHGRQQLCTQALTVTTAAPPPAVGEGRSPKPHPLNWEEPLFTGVPELVIGRTTTAPPASFRTTALPLVFGTTATPVVVGTGDGWKVINPLRWVGSGGRGRQARKVIDHGGRIVKKLRSSEDGLAGRE